MELILILLAFWFILTIPKKVRNFRSDINRSLVDEQLRSLPPDQYLTLRNIPLTYDNDRMASLFEFIVISVYGVFVIGTRHYAGQIRGTVEDKFWVELSKGKERRFYNPIRQNNDRAKVLQAGTHLVNTPFFPVTVFGDDCDLSIGAAESMVYTSDVKKFILSHQTRCVGPEDLDKIARRIRCLSKGKPVETNDLTRP